MVFSEIQNINLKNCKVKTRYVETTELFLRVISSLTFLSVSGDGTNMKEVLTVLTETVLGRLVRSLEVLGERQSVRTQQLTEMTATSLPVQ